MGFDCQYCGKREVNAFESHVVDFMCWDCHRAAGYPENAKMRLHREANEPSTIKMRVGRTGAIKELLNALPADVAVTMGVFSPK